MFRAKPISVTPTSSSKKPKSLVEPVPKVPNLYSPIKPNQTAFMYEAINYVNLIAHEGRFIRPELLDRYLECRTGVLTGAMKITDFKKVVYDILTETFESADMGNEFQLPNRPVTLLNNAPYKVTDKLQFKAIYDQIFLDINSKNASLRGYAKKTLAQNAKFYSNAPHSLQLAFAKKFITALEDLKTTDGEVDEKDLEEKITKWKKEEERIPQDIYWESLNKSIRVLIANVNKERTDPDSYMIGMLALATIDEENKRLREKVQIEAIAEAMLKEQKEAELKANMAKLDSLLAKPTAVSVKKIAAKTASTTNTAASSAGSTPAITAQNVINGIFSEIDASRSGRQAYAASLSAQQRIQNAIKKHHGANPNTQFGATAASAARSASVVVTTTQTTSTVTSTTTSRTTSTTVVRR